MRKNFLFLFVIFIICGCSSSKNIIISNPVDKIPVISGSVADASAFEKGGTLELGSFKPGTGAAANNETDRLSSMIVEGIKNTLPGDNTQFTVRTDDQKDPDCYLEGYIEDYGSKGHLAHLSIDGKIWLRDTGGEIFLFQTSTTIDLKNQDPNAVAYQIGVAIAHFIGSYKESNK